jgi:hypothetical protein
MHLRYEGNRAYLSLDESATVADRHVFTHEDHREAWGMNFDFDADGHLVGIEFEDPGRQLPEGLLADGAGLLAEHDKRAGAAYFYLTKIRKGAVEHTLAFGEEETHAGWGINLDFDADDRLLGIGFESDDLAPPALLDRAHGLLPVPLPGRVRVLMWRVADEFDRVASGVRERRRPRRGRR